MAKHFEQFQNRELFGFIDYLEILDEMEGNPASAKIREDDAVSLMSIHAAKGLEFRVVFVTNLAKDKFPLLRGTVLHQLDQKIIYPHYDFKHLTEKYFEIGMKLDDFLIQLVKYWR